MARLDQTEVVVERSTGRALGSLLFSEEELVPWIREWQGMPEFGEEPLAYRTLRVHFETPDAILKFADLTEQKITDDTRSLWYPAKEKHDMKSIGYETDEP